MRVTLDRDVVSQREYEKIYSRELFSFGEKGKEERTPSASTTIPLLILRGEKISRLLCRGVDGASTKRTSFDLEEGLRIMKTNQSQQKRGG